MPGYIITLESKLEYSDAVTTLLHHIQHILCQNHSFFFKKLYAFMWLFLFDNNTEKQKITFHLWLKEIVLLTEFKVRIQLSGHIFLIINIWVFYYYFAIIFNTYYYFYYFQYFFQYIFPIIFNPSSYFYFILIVLLTKFKVRIQPLCHIFNLYTFKYFILSVTLYAILYGISSHRKVNLST